MSNYSKLALKSNSRKNPRKKVLIWGLGLNNGGAGSAKFFCRQGAEVVITDLKTRKNLASSLIQLRHFPDIKYVLGRHRLRDFLTSDLIIKNPAALWSNPFIQKTRAKGIKISSETMLFFEQSPAPIVGVTGTKGKSTTATLLAELLKSKYRQVWLLGNIQESFLEKLPQIKSRDIVVAELSSFQLEDLAYIKKSPYLAIITNIFPDHLNRYDSFQKYTQAKTNIFLYQKPSDHLVLNGNDKFLKKLTEKTKSQRHFVSEKKMSPLPINCSLAVKAAKILGIAQKDIKKVLKNFRGLAGRLEIIREFHKRIFINDTTATNPTAVLFALQTLNKKYQKPIILIAGGEDKNLDYQTLSLTLNKQIKKLVLLPGSATEKLKKNLKIEFWEAKNMKAAVETAYRISAAGDLILLSPGAASFNLFQNEFDRGRQFNDCVKKLFIPSK